MSKGTQFLTLAIPSIIAYFLAFFHILPIPFVSAETLDLILPVLPWWLLVSFGAYSLSSLGLGLLRFHDTPEAYESLLKEINQAKLELRDAGVTVD
ncbi:dolichol-phosphate mannosyltransferase subunit 3 [Kockovaella imperatae]|uniref:Dolichol-phosphate mannosyltransferase subunit 3 n=1 Tax=Kockovaella imperatae TaxID=4999 RepID=A0A1Y1UUN9_9TREE|nr:dolichol-phosphate mannosyltransferase subunit 3 [Kockovaella imperatae]ORX41294.1 dolichol-phosphate mannosyltransferase subunit 3 [Kockovaella imperatae]